MTETAPSIGLDRLTRVRGGSRLRLRLLRAWVLRSRARSHWFRREPNFGDALAPQILEWLLGVPPVWVPRHYSGKVLGVGSVLSDVRENDIVWGTGAIENTPIRVPRGVSILAVRGPLSASLLDTGAPSVFGDPVLLLPHFYRERSEKQHGLGIVPHYVDRDVVRVDDPSIAVIDVRQPWREVVDRIRSCEVILSSSLHGIIVAEAYGIPAGWIAVTDRLFGGRFKFHDYYLSTGRDPGEPARWTSGLDACLAAVRPPMEFDAGPLLAAGARLADRS